jgi:dolichol kinase
VDSATAISHFLTSRVARNVWDFDEWMGGALASRRTATEWKGDERAMSVTTDERIRALLEGREIERRLVHASGSGLPLLYLLTPVTWLHLQGLFVFGAILALVLEALRHSGRINWRIYDHLTREYEQNTIAGYALYFISNAAVVLVFEPQIAVPAVFMLTLGDPISGLVAAEEFRQVKRPRTLLVMFVTSALIATPFLYETPLAIVLGAAGAMVADGVKPMVRGHVVDDNLTIPPVAATLMVLGVAVAGG